MRPPPVVDQQRAHDDMTNAPLSINGWKGSSADIDEIPDWYGWTKYLAIAGTSTLAGVIKVTETRLRFDSSVNPVNRDCRLA
jgi:hypothetical protein